MKAIFFLLFGLSLQLSITISTTSLSKESNEFFTKSLSKFLEKEQFKGLATVKLVFFGKTKVIGDNQFQCEFGEDDCLGNKVFVCTKKKYITMYQSGYAKYLATFAICMAKMNEINNVFLGIDWKSRLSGCLQAEITSSIMECAQSELGIKYLLEEAKEVPSVTYTPWALVSVEGQNPVHKKEFDSEIKDDILEFACKHSSKESAACKEVSAEW